MSQLKLHFYANYFFDPKTYMQRHILGRGACQMSLIPLLLQLAKGWRYTTPLKMENSIENANFEQVQLRPCLTHSDATSVHICVPSCLTTFIFRLLTYDPQISLHFELNEKQLKSSSFQDFCAKCTKSSTHALWTLTNKTESKKLKLKLNFKFL